jgi:hypothetical protein
MRYILGLWLAPLVLFWGWFFLSLNDINFGYVMLSRQLHDLVFQLYGQALGVDPAVIPGMVAKACILDSFLLAGIWAFRRRRAIAGWLRKKRGLPSVSTNGEGEPVQTIQHTLQDEGGSRGINLAGALGARDVHFDQRTLGGNGR